MSRIGERTVGQHNTEDRAFSFWLTLFVTTLLVALTVYVLSGAFFEPGVYGPAHRAVATAHARA